jgi:protein involved in polysaccharide export with SLBB domain
MISFFLLIFTFAGFIEVLGAELQIKPGNIVHITVLGYPELSKSVLVRQDGSTDYPLLANVPIDGMTVHQLQEALRPILVRFVERPKLFINVAEHIQFDITVEGQVIRPGPYTVKGPINLQGVLSIAGGTTQLADLRIVTISRRDYDSQREIVIDLNEFFIDPENAALPEIQDGDIVFVPMISSASTVRVMGGVRSPGTFNPLKDNNIADMIYMAGGPSVNGNLHHVIYISMHDGRHKTEVINLRSLINKGQNELIPLVYPGDIIVVREKSWWQERSWWVSLVRDIALILSSIVIISSL